LLQRFKYEALADTDPSSIVIYKSLDDFSEFNNAERKGTFYFSPTHLP